MAEVVRLSRVRLSVLRQNEFQVMDGYDRRFLIPTTPAINESPRELPKPSEPDWLSPGSLGDAGALEDDERISLFKNDDYATVES